MSAEFNDTVSCPCLDDQPKRMSRLLRSASLKSNSTTTIFATGSLLEPKVDYIVVAFSLVINARIAYNIENNMISNSKTLDAFIDEEFYPLDTDIGEVKKCTPTVAQVFVYVSDIFVKARLTPDCVIIALVYINKLICHGLNLNHKNWRYVVSISMILAQKVWLDKNIDNYTFIKLTEVMPLTYCNKLEVLYLSILSYDLLITGVTYARYYFELRLYLEKETIHQLAQKKLNGSDLFRLEAKTESFSIKMKQQFFKNFQKRRSLSQDSSIITVLDSNLLVSTC